MNNKEHIANQKDPVTRAKLQGRDEIIADIPIEKMWPLIADTMELPNWGPPVRGVKILGESGQEGVGSRRRVEAEFDGKRGYYVERRTEHVPGEKIAYVIEEENFGLFRILSKPGFSLELKSAGVAKTRVIFSFFHDTKGLIGRILNVLVVLRQQRRNRLAALASLKRYAESQYGI